MQDMPSKVRSHLQAGFVCPTYQQIALYEMPPLRQEVISQKSHLQIVRSRVQRSASYVARGK